jgi:hypothetical protein
MRKCLGTRCVVAESNPRSNSGTNHREQPPGATLEATARGQPRKRPTRRAFACRFVATPAACRPAFAATPAARRPAFAATPAARRPAFAVGPAAYRRTFAASPG